MPSDTVKVCTKPALPILESPGKYAALTIKYSGCSEEHSVYFYFVH